MSATMEIDVFWSFRSPWSYLATKRLHDWQTKYQLQVNFRAVYPIAVRLPEFFDQVQPQWFSYFATDVRRVAEFLELPFAAARPDPVIQHVDADGRRHTDSEQPYIYRLTRLGALAEELGKGIEFADEVSALIWGGTKGWDQGDHLAQAAARAGLNLAEMDERIVAEAERLDAVIDNNQRDHDQSGHWGVPTCTYNGEPFFGQDRLDVLLWRLQKEGLQER